jgi:hypothetical protein
MAPYSATLPEQAGTRLLMLERFQHSADPRAKAIVATGTAIGIQFGDAAQSPPLITAPLWI